MPLPSWGAVLPYPAVPGASPTLLQQCVHPELLPLHKEQKQPQALLPPQKESRDGSLHSWGRAQGQKRGAAQAPAPSALCVAQAQLGTPPARLLDVGTTTHPKLPMQEPVGQKQLRDVVSSQ